MAQVERATSSGGNMYKTKLIHNFEYPSSNVNWSGVLDERLGSFFLGYNSIIDTGTNTRNWLEFNPYIPNNFIITEAYITFLHTPVWWDNVETFWGYCRNIKAYKVNNISNILVSAVANGGFSIYGGYDEKEIYGAFGDNGYTPTIPTNDSYKTETFLSSNIKDILDIGDNKIIVRSSGDTPEYSGEIIENNSVILPLTGFARAILSIKGYYQ
jgi:hypothetical protein